MDILLRDLRYALRILINKPGFTIVAVLTLALGIGANTAVFSVVNAVLLRPLPYGDPDRLVFVSEKSAEIENKPFSLPNYHDWRDRNQTFEDMAAYKFADFNLTGIEPSERLQGAMVSASIFDVLNVEPALGRSFLEEDDKLGSNRVLAISHGLWERRFGKQQDVIGKTLELDGQSYTIIAVTPRDFKFPPSSDRVDVWVPIELFGDKWITSRNTRPAIYAVGRLKSGVSLDLARTQMDVLAGQLEKEYPESNAGNRANVTLLQTQVVKDMRPALLILMGTVGCILLIGCINVANLLLVRAISRQGEIAVRLAVGANRRHLIRQLITESMVLSLIGGGIGLLLANYGLNVLLSIIPENYMRLGEIKIDPWTLIFTFLISLLAGVIFGLVPSFHASKLDLNDMLKESGRSLMGGAAIQRLRGLLVVVEIAIAFVLLIGSGLMIKSFMRVMDQNPGFDPNNVLTMQMTLPEARYPKEQQRAQFSEQSLQRVQSLPGVRYAGLITPLPVSGAGWQTTFLVEGRPEPGPGEKPLADLAMVSPDYFQAMGGPIMEGRYFTDQDRDGAQMVAIIDETMAHRFWPDETPTGKRLRKGAANSPWLTIVGVVKHVKNYGVAEKSNMELFTPYLQNPVNSLTLVVRTNADATGLIAGIRSEITKVDKDQPIYNIRTMEQVLATSLAQRRTTTVLLTIFGAVALSLSIVGIYGVMAYSVSQRRHEIGVRMALGAQRSDIMKLILRQGLILIVFGIAIGVGGSSLLSRLLTSLLFGVSPFDPITFVGVLLGLIMVGMLACYIPALKATKVDPTIALKSE
jgi:putative ABC transport system permease protein